MQFVYCLSAFLLLQLTKQNVDSFEVKVSGHNMFCSCVMTAINELGSSYCPPLDCTITLKGAGTGQFFRIYERFPPLSSLQSGIMHAVKLPF